MLAQRDPDEAHGCCQHKTVTCELAPVRRALIAPGGNQLTIHIVTNFFFKSREYHLKSSPKKVNPQPFSVSLAFSGLRGRRGAGSRGKYWIHHKPSTDSSQIVSRQEYAPYLCDFIVSCCFRIISSVSGGIGFSKRLRRASAKTLRTSEPVIGFLE